MTSVVWVPVSVYQIYFRFARSVGTLFRKLIWPS